MRMFITSNQVLYYQILQEYRMQTYLSMLDNLKSSKEPSSEEENTEDISSCEEEFVDREV